MIADEKLQNLINDLQDDLGPHPRWQELEDAVSAVVDNRAQLVANMKGIHAISGPEWAADEVG